MAQKTDLTKLILPIGILFLASDALGSILQALGLQKDPLTARNQAALQPGGAFSPTYWELQRPALLLTTAAANAYAEDLYDSVHAYWFNEPSVFIGTMQRMKTKSQVSFLAATFSARYGKSLLSYLGEYLTPDQLATGIRITDALPNFTT